MHRQQVHSWQWTIDSGTQEVSPSEAIYIYKKISPLQWALCANTKVCNTRYYEPTAKITEIMYATMYTDVSIGLLVAHKCYWSGATTPHPDGRTSYNLSDHQVYPLKTVPGHGRSLWIIQESQCWHVLRLRTLHLYTCSFPLKWASKSLKNNTTWSIHTWIHAYM